MKEEVLKLEYQEVFENGVAVRIVHQDEKILKRGRFEDEEVKVFSCRCPDFDCDNLCIRGVNKKRDNDIFIVSKEEAETIKYRVKKINEKYGIEKRWRAEIRDKYFLATCNGTVECYIEDKYKFDDECYNFGNYFKTKEQADEALERVKKTLADYQEELKCNM